MADDTDHWREAARRAAGQAENLDAGGVIFALLYVGDQIGELVERDAVRLEAETCVLPSTSTARVALVAKLIGGMAGSGYPYADDVQNVLNEWLVLKEGDAGVSAGE